MLLFMRGDLKMELKKEENELISFFMKEIKKELENKSNDVSISKEELNFTTKQILSMLAKSLVKKFLDY